MKKFLCLLFVLTIAFSVLSPVAVFSKDNGSFSVKLCEGDLLGDADGDGEVNDWDFILMGRYLAGWKVTVNTDVLDVDGDGDVTDWDFILLGRYLSGWKVMEFATLSVFQTDILADRVSNNAAGVAVYKSTPPSGAPYNEGEDENITLGLADRNGTKLFEGYGWFYGLQARLYEDVFSVHEDDYPSNVMEYYPDEYNAFVKKDGTEIKYLHDGDGAWTSWMIDGYAIVAPTKDDTAYMGDEFPDPINPYIVDSEGNIVHTFTDEFIGEYHYIGVGLGFPLWSFDNIPIQCSDGLITCVESDFSHWDPQVLGYYFTDFDENVIIDLRGTDMSPFYFYNGYCLVRDSSWKFGYIDKTGEVVIPIEYDNAYIQAYKDGLFFVYKDGKWGAVNTNNEVVIPFEYDEVRWDDSVICAQKDGKWGYLSFDNEVILPFEYDAAYGGENGIFSVGINGKFGLVDKTGKELIAPEYDDISGFFDGVAYAVKDRTLYVITLNMQCPS
ncbi:MAG: WG repeat-containing protein [Clostridia bacterium]|nr:WG repeat-containing protein [Clostridia bacterium]